MLATARLLRFAPKSPLSQRHSRPHLNQSYPLSYYPSLYRGFSSTVSTTKETTPSSGDKQKPKQTPNDHVLPNLNLKELIGANRKVYYFVLAVLSVLGTMETVFWCKVIYAKFFAPGSERDGDAEGMRENR